MLHLPIPDEALVEDPPYYHPGMSSPEVEYLVERRRALGGTLPLRRGRRSSAPELPAADALRGVLRGHARRPRGVDDDGVRAAPPEARCATRRSVRRIVPIIPDEARTFGMESLFKELGIYASKGQLYEPVDHN